MPQYYGQTNSRSPMPIAEQESLLRSLAGDTWEGAKGLGSSLLWLLSRPFHAVSGAVSGTLDNPGMGTLEGLFGGLTGQGKYSDVYYGDVFQKMGIDKGDPLAPSLPWFFGDITGRDIAAGALNVLLDPLMYVGIGELSQAGREASLTGKLLNKGGLAATKADQLRLGQRIALNFKLPGLMDKPYEFEIANRLLNKPSIWLAEKAGNIRSSKLWEGLFGVATDDVFKGMQKQAKAGERALAEKYLPAVKFIDETIDNMARTLNKDRSYIEGKIVEFVEDPVRKKARWEWFYNKGEKGKFVDQNLLQREKFREEFGNKFLEVTDEIEFVNNQLLMNERNAGINIAELNGELDYIAHAATPELKEVLQAIKKKTTRGTVYTNTDLLLNALERHPKLRDKTLAEANAMLKKYYKLEGDAFFLDPALIMTYRLKKSAKAVTGHEFLRNFLETYGMPVGGSIQPGMLNVTDHLKHLGKRWYRITNPYLSDMYKELHGAGLLPKRMRRFKSMKNILFPEKLAKIVDEVAPIYTQGVSPLAGLLDAYNKHFFKPWVTVVSPAYGVRNIIDDSIRASLAGLHITKKETWDAYKEAGMIIGKTALEDKNITKQGLLKSQRMIKGLIEDGKYPVKWSETVPGLDITYGQLRKELERNGIKGGGFLDSHIYNAIDKSLKVDGEAIARRQAAKGIGYKFKDYAAMVFDPSRNVWMKNMKKINTTREDLTRSALYILKRREGYSEGAATKIVNKYLYDYENLGAGDKVIRNFIPFWSFTRQNTPLWASMVIEKPRVFSLLNKVLPQEKNMMNIPDFMQEGIPIQISDNKNGKKSYIYSFGLSLEELNKITLTKPFRTVEKFFLSSLTPVLKYPLEEATNRNFYFNTKLGQYAKAYSILKHLPNSIKEFIDFKEKRTKDGTAYYRMNPEALHVITNLPTARIYSMFGKTFDEDRTWYDKFENSILGFRTGIVDTEEERRRKIKRGIKTFLSESQLRGDPVRSMEILYIPKEERDMASPELKQAVELFKKKVSRLK